jgi:tetratricopeptide (TPR) repeat protein
VPEAFARADAAVAAQPNNALAHNMRGELFLATRRYPQAAEELTQATRLDPHLWLPYRNLALTQIESGDLKAAASTYEGAIAAAGMIPTLVIDLAALYERQGRIDDAIKIYRALHDRSPRLEAVSNNLAMLLVTYRKDQVSLNEAQELTSAFDHSDSPSLLDTQGWVRFKRGDLVEAIPELEAAAARAPNSKVIRYHLGMAQIEAKQLAKARSNLESALQGGQSFEGAEEARTALAKLRS